MEELLLKLKTQSFVNYVTIVLIVAVAIIFYIGPRYGKQNVFVYLILCSLIGSITVTSCKGLGLALRQTALGMNELSNWLTWFLLFSVILCIMTQMNYLNKSLDLFNTGIVTPIYYVLFTSFVMIASAILFHEWKYMRVEDILGTICGFLTVILAVFLLNAFRDTEINYRHMSHMLRPKREIGNLDCWRDESVPINTDIEHGFSPGTMAIWRWVQS